MGVATTETQRVNMLAYRLVASSEWQLSVETTVETSLAASTFLNRGGPGSRNGGCEPEVRTSSANLSGTHQSAYLWCVPACVL